MQRGREHWKQYSEEQIISLGQSAVFDIIHAKNCGYPQEQIDEYIADAEALKAEIDRRRNTPQIDTRR